MTRSTLDTRLRYSATCFCGPPASSMMTSSIGVPPKPFWVWGAGTPPALRNSAISSAELRAGTPKGPAAGPDSSVTMPTLIGCCASAADVASSIMSTASAARNLKLDDSGMVSSSISVSLKHGPFGLLAGLARETARASLRCGIYPPQQLARTWFTWRPHLDYRPRKAITERSWQAPGRFFRLDFWTGRPWMAGRQGG